VPALDPTAVVFFAANQNRPKRGTKPSGVVARVPQDDVIGRRAATSITPGVFDNQPERAKAACQ
jgi:hypothetical protein